MNRRFNTLINRKNADNNFIAWWDNSVNGSD
jgi:hypothetical protein